MPVTKYDIKCQENRHICQITAQYIEVLHSNKGHFSSSSKGP